MPREDEGRSSDAIEAAHTDASAQSAGIRWPAVALSAATMMIAGVASIAACGPSYQSIYEGDARFEHCYALDDASDIPLTRKRDCWNEWRAHSTVGQSRDRVEYANARAAALTRAQMSPTDDSLMQAAPGGGTTNQVLAPEATNAFAPPPKTLESMDGGASMAVAQGPQPSVVGANGTNAMGSSISGSASASGGDTAPRGNADGGVIVIAANAPGSSCAGSCASGLQSCRVGCSSANCTSCDATYRKCMRGCFK